MDSSGAVGVVAVRAAVTAAAVAAAAGCRGGSLVGGGRVEPWALNVV